MSKHYKNKVKQIQAAQKAKQLQNAKKQAKQARRQATRTAAVKTTKATRVGKPRGHYKVYSEQNNFSLPNQRQHDSLRQQVQRFFDLNKELIKSQKDFAKVSDDKIIDVLVNKVKTYKESQGFKTVKETLEFLVEHTTVVRPQQDIFAENIIKAMKDYGVWQDFLDLNISEDGEQLPVINSLFSWEGSGIYVYDDRIVIEITNGADGSSYGIDVYRKY